MDGESNDTADLTVQVTKGPEVYVGPIEITGDSRTAEHVIRRELGFAEGERFASRMLDRARQRRLNLQYFGRVDVSTRVDCPS